MQIVQQDRLRKSSPWQLLRIWASIGLQSFGGGASTTFLIQREFTEKRHWLTMEEFIHYWSLCVFAPGINLIALTILLGRKLGGPWGIVSSLCGLLLPSATITCLLAAGFQRIEQLSAVQAVFKGVIPATAGIMFLIGLRFALPQFKVARLEGTLSVILSALLVLACFVAIGLFNLSAVLVLPLAGLLGILLFMRYGKRSPEVTKRD